MRAITVAATLSCVLAGCAAVRPPQVDVLQARLSGGGLLDQQLQVQLCVSNPNPRELAFSRVSFEVDVGGRRLASGVNESPVTLPPMGAVALPFAVATTTRNLGTQLGSVFESGTIPYTVSGRIVLRDFGLVGIPYSVSGRVTPADIAAGLIGVAGDASAPGACAATAPPAS
ncbi:MAG: LEA type 2 family protein [Janthinobacterium lividum]